MNNPPARSFFNADDLSLLIMEHPDAPQFLAVKIADEHDAAMAQSRSRIEALESRLHSVRAAALEEAAVIAETWFDHHKPQQPKKSRFNIYDIEHWAKSATRLVAEDIRALAGDAP